jgi:hypothetical protein
MHFKSYKDKVLYILQRVLENQIEEESGEILPPVVLPEHIKWCIHVIKNDFLQISNSLPS